jgi:superfamily II DNA helicase RecQ
MLDYITFLTCLEFAVLNSLYKETILKPKQVLCLENVYLHKDVMCVLPTGYGKSLIFQLLPMLLFAKSKLLDHVRLGGFSAAAVNSIVVVVSPLNSLMSNQISRLRISGVRAAVIDVKELRKEHADHETDLQNENMEIEIDFRLCEERKLRDGHYHFVFAHPETLVSSKYGRELLLSETYQENVIAIVVDEAHCIVEWLVSYFLYKQSINSKQF